ncbi:hypothetical protein HH310_19530 [Actinoplanes sp. TBRC 11911]|uniref:hypothetical protein n=1 Tax=Actinoplanes sp. TBRC 11911 TaxID=2729386 RepID=UPI00145CA194|nr:hypothetical protein [Actinoplanes sp. TBRC 11911]NMO53371.1 hypothetical protein [Actinoplanes sp. TBRC 11911]
MRPTALARTVALLGATVATIATTTGCTTSTTTPAPPAAAMTSAPAVPVAAIPIAAKPATPAPALKNTGTAWPTVIGSMLTYGQWLVANPNPALAGTITEPGCASATALTAQLQSLLDQNARVQPAAITLTSVTGPYPATPGTTTTAKTTATTAPVGSIAEIDVQAARAAEPIIEHSITAAKPATASSAIIELADQPALAPTTLHITLNLGSDNRWRFCTIADAINDPDGEAITTVL